MTVEELLKRIEDSKLKRKSYLRKARHELDELILANDDSFRRFELERMVDTFEMDIKHYDMVIDAIKTELFMEKFGLEEL